MTGMDDQRFEVGFTPLPTAARVTRQRGALKWRWVTTIISVVILVVIVYFFPPDWSSWVTWAFAVLWVGSSVFWLVVNLVGLSRAKRDLESIQPGPSFFVDPEGLEFVAPQEAVLRWGEIDALTVTGGRGGAGPRLAVVAGGTVVAEVPFSMLDASPTVIDSMVRAHSLGRHHLDAAKLEASV